MDKPGKNVEDAVIIIVIGLLRSTINYSPTRLCLLEIN